MSSLIYRTRLFRRPCASFALFMSLVLLSVRAGAEPTGDLSSSGANDSPGGAEPPKNALSIQWGAGLTASGGVIDSAGGGLDLLENLINARLLYSPEITPFVEQIGPIYQIPEFDLFSNEVAINYERNPEARFGWGASVKYFDITGKVDLPSSYILSPRLPFEFPLEPPLFYQVTKRSEQRLTLAAVFQADANFYWRFRPGEAWNPYAKLSAGVGRGWLGDFGRGPYIEEAHAGLALGLRWRYAEGLFLYAEGSYQYYVARTGPSSFLDRTEVLVNPRRGDVIISRASIGAGVLY